MATSTRRPDDRSFESVDWDEVGAGPVVRLRTVAFLGSLVALCAGFVYDYRYVRGYTVAEVRWTASRLDWLFLLAILLFVFYVVVPLATDRELTAQYWRRLRRDRLAVAALAYLAAFFVLGSVGPFLLGRPDLELAHRFQPPLLVTVSGDALNQCLGPLADGRCTGTLRYPLGTDQHGYGLVRLVVLGMRVSLFVALVTSVIVVPVAVVVGTVAGYVGGLADELLMRYVDVQQTVPAIAVYLILLPFLEKGLFLMIVVFGLFSWGGIARLVRAEVVQRRSEEYVLAARGAGAGRLAVIRRHVLPNVSNTVAPALAQQIPVLVLTETALAFLDLGDTDLTSWGITVARGVGTDFAPFPEKWWVSTVTVVALAVTVVAFKLAGDGLRDALDPRGGR